MAKSQALKPRNQGKQHRALQTRERILNAAAQVFADNGYSAGTTNRIAATAGLSIGSLYQYFPNKDSILVELVHAHVNEGLAILQEKLASQTSHECLEDLVRIFVQATIANHLDEPGLHQVLFEEAPRPPELLEMLHAAEDWIVGATRAILDEHSEVRVVDTEAAARLVVSSIESLVHRYFGAKQPISVERFENELVSMITRYLQAN